MKNRVLVALVAFLSATVSSWTDPTRSNTSSSAGEPGGRGLGTEEPRGMAKNLDRTRQRSHYQVRAAQGKRLLTN